MEFSENISKEDLAGVAGQAPSIMGATVPVSRRACQLSILGMNGWGHAPSFHQLWMETQAGGSQREAWSMPTLAPLQISSNQVIEEMP